MPLDNAAAAFIGASVTLVLVIIFMILMVILVRQCLAFLAKRSAIRAQVQAQRQARAEFERQRRVSVTEPVPATFDWHHSIRIAGTPPPTYREAEKLPALVDGIVAEDQKEREGTDGAELAEVIQIDNDSLDMIDNRAGKDVMHRRDVAVSIAMVNERNGQVGSEEEGVNRSQVETAASHDSYVNTDQPFED